MTRDAQAITVLCSHLGLADQIRPLEPAEWNRLAGLLVEQGMTPGCLLDFTRQDFESALYLGEDQAARLSRLIDRSGSLMFELEKYEEMGIHTVTRADGEYPEKLKKKLKQAAPPLFYTAGELSLLQKSVLGFVGSRNLAEDDLTFAQEAVRKGTENGYGVVSGGARGVDSVAALAAMEEGFPVIEFLADSMLRKLRNAELLRKIRDGMVLLLSFVNPTAGFQVGNAMARNKFIYAQSEATVVIRSDLRKGGTWAGAQENLKHGWCPTLCRDCAYPGNRELIRLGAEPINEQWDGSIQVRSEPKPGIRERYQQVSMFA